MCLVGVDQACLHLLKSWRHITLRHVCGRARGRAVHSRDRSCIYLRGAPIRDGRVSLRPTVHIRYRGQMAHGCHNGWVRLDDTLHGVPRACFQVWVHFPGDRRGANPWRRHANPVNFAARRLSANVRATRISSLDHSLVALGAVLGLGCRVRFVRDRAANGCARRLTHRRVVVRGKS